LGPSGSFTRAILERVSNPEVIVHIVNVAVSGSNIESWDPSGDGAENWNGMLPYLDKALETGILVGTVWHQGEANGGTPAPEYVSRLTAIINATRARSGNANMPFIAGRVGAGDAASPVNEAMEIMHTTIPNFRRATNEGLTLRDDAHYDAPSQRIYGRRYAERFWEIIESQ
jgi:hypothetical protein